MRIEKKGAAVNICYFRCFMFLLVSVFTVSNIPAFAQAPEHSGVVEEAIVVFRENSRMLEEFESSFQAIQANNEEILWDVNYLRIRRRKQGRRLPPE